MDYIIMLFLGLLGVLCPIFNTEVTFYIMVNKGGNLILLSAAAAIGSSAAYCVFYWMGLKARGISGRLREKVEKIDINKFKKSSIAVTGSSFILSLPPSTPLAVVAGMLKYHFPKFIALVLVFRMIKYTLIAYFYDSINVHLHQFYQYIKSILGIF